MPLWLDLLVLLIPLLLSSSASDWLCPGNQSFFDPSPCDPNVRFGCPPDFKCRLAFQAGDERQIRFLCCASAEMGIREWLLESGLSPQVFPRSPPFELQGVVLRDPESGGLASVERNGAEVSLLAATGGNSSFANFSQLQAIQFRQGLAPAPGGFLHLMDAVNQLNPPSALRLHFDYPSFGSERLDLSEMNKRFARGYAEAIGPGFVPANDFYRRQHVLLVFKTDLPLQNNSAEIGRWISASEGKFSQLMWENGSRMPALLGDPLLGFLFSVTTRGSIFPVIFAISSPIPPLSTPPDVGQLSHEPGLTERTPIVGQLSHDPGLLGEEGGTTQPSDNAGNDTSVADGQKGASAETSSLATTTAHCTTLIMAVFLSALGHFFQHLY